MTKIGIKEKIGAMLLVGFRGLDVGAGDPIVRDIGEYSLGSTILFDVDVALKDTGGNKKRNFESPEQVRQLNRQLQEVGGGRLLISVDQEGGKVNRLKEKYGFLPPVSAQELGERDDLVFTGEQAETMARQLKHMGINWNHAPVVDLNVNRANPVIGKIGRSFSPDPDVVTRHALEFIDAHHRAGVLTTLKHFPGHGSSTVDSHKGFTDITGTWSEKELEPFSNIIAENKADAIMTAHVFNQNLDETYPATLSKAIITGLLREKLGFGGVIVSDDMQMGAIRDFFPFETALRRVIEAGADIICFGNNLHYDPGIVPKVTALILKWLDSGEIDEKRIDESYERIAAFRREP